MHFAFMTMHASLSQVGRLQSWLCMMKQLVPFTCMMACWSSASHLVLAYAELMLLADKFSTTK